MYLLTSGKERYSVVKYLEIACKDIGMPIKEGISALNNISLIEKTIKTGIKNM